jgi:hypothetical protein
MPTKIPTYENLDIDCILQNKSSESGIFLLLKCQYSETICKLLRHVLSKICLLGSIWCVLGGSLSIFMGLFLGAGLDNPLMQGTQMELSSWISATAFSVMGILFLSVDCVAEMAHGFGNENIYLHQALEFHSSSYHISESFSFSGTIKTRNHKYYCCRWMCYWRCNIISIR